MADKIMSNGDLIESKKTDIILVCIGTSIYSENLVKAAFRFAKKNNAEMIALYVETENTLALPDELREMVTKNLQLAESLGAVVKRITGKSVEKEIIKLAQQYDISKIVIGKPSREKSGKLFKRNLAEKIIKHSRGMDVFVLHYKENDKLEIIHPQFERKRDTLHYLISLLLVALATGAGYPFRGIVSPTNLVMLYLCVVVISALYSRLKYAVLSSVLGVLAFNFFFTEPYYTLTVYDTQYIITFIALLGISLVISVLVSRAKKQSRAAMKRESRIQALFALNKDLYTANSREKITAAAVHNINENLKMECVLFIPDNNVLFSYNPGPCEVPADISEMANWAYKKGERAGYGTGHMNATDWCFFPLNTTDKTMGVLGIKISKKKPVDTEENDIFSTFSHQLALALENIQSEGKLFSVKL